MKAISTDGNTPDYSDFKTKMARDAEQVLKLNTEILYLPLINVPPTRHKNFNDSFG